MPKGTVGTELVKGAYDRVSYDATMLKEFQECCDHDTGPSFFMNNFVLPTKSHLSH